MVHHSKVISEMMKTLAEIEVIVEVKGRPPTVRELAKARGVSYSTTQRHLDLLELYGYIERKAGKHGTLRVLLLEERMR